MLEEVKGHLTLTLSTGACRCGVQGVLTDARRQQHSPGHARSKGVPLGRHFFKVHGI